jgi:hypothetical protein
VHVGAIAAGEAVVAHNAGRIATLLKEHFWQRRAADAAAAFFFEMLALENPSRAVPPLPILPKPFAAAKAFNCDATFAPITTPFRIGERYVSFGKGPKAFFCVQPVNRHPSLTRAEAAEALVRSGIAVAPMGWRRLSPGESWRGPNKWGECSYMHDGKNIVDKSNHVNARIMGCSVRYCR